MSTEVTIIDKKKKLELAEMISITTNLGKQLSEITISDSNSLSQANDVVTKGKKLKKKITDLRKELSAPIDNERKELMDIEKKLLGPLKKGLDIAAKSIVSYTIEQDRKKREELP